MALEGSWAKIHRADEQIGALYAEIKHALRWDRLVEAMVSYDPSVYTEPVEGAYRVWAKVEDAPIRWGVLIGEIVHDLRSALDQTFFALADGPGMDPRDLQFPIFKEEPNYDRWRAPGIWGRKRRKDPMRHVSDTARRVICLWQPFQDKARGEDPAANVLARLNEMSNFDKHRITTPVVTGLVSAGWGVSRINWPNGLGVELIDQNAHWPIDKPIKNRDSLMALRFDPPISDLQVEVKAAIPAAVFLDEERELLPTLQSFEEAVIEVVTSLEPEVA